MTPTFIVNEHLAILRSDGERFDGGGDGVTTPDSGNLASSQPGHPWRTLSALLSWLFGRRRRLPPQDEHLRRDIGLSERELPREYWEYWWHHR